MEPGTLPALSGVEGNMERRWPSVTCLCPTYGRLGRLRDALACFLRQDYAGEVRLIILNDAPAPVILGRGHTAVSVLNAPSRYPTLGHKRQALLEMASTPLVAHWDDDDVYLPWHLTAIVGALLSHPGARCAKPGSAWLGWGPPGRWELRGVRRNTFEGQMVFDRDRALELGGYPPIDSGQAAALLAAFRRGGELHTYDSPPHELSYIYRWGDGLCHVSARQDNPPRDADFGGRPPLPGQPLRALTGS
jgi:hypothetical protein